jgi:excisionase family DNA binding protein
MRAWVAAGDGGREREKGRSDMTAKKVKRPLEPTPPPADAQLLMLEEAAYVLRVSVDSVRRLVKEGRIAHVPATVKGAAKRILRDTLEDFIRSSERIKAPELEADKTPKYSMVKAGWDGRSRLRKPRAPK